MATKKAARGQSRKRKAAEPRKSGSKKAAKKTPAEKSSLRARGRGPRSTGAKKSAKKTSARKTGTKKTGTKKTGTKKTGTKKTGTKKTAKKSPAKRPLARELAAERPAVATVAEERSPGREAIDAACASVHPDLVPFHIAPLVKAEVGGEDPLELISVYRCDRGEPHWHYVTYGFSDLHEKTSDDPELSGFGFELSFRLRRGDEREPPAWPCDLLQSLARYVFRTGNPFGVGHHIPLQSPIVPGVATEIRSVALAVDPELGKVDTPFGEVEFLQLVGINRDEASAIKYWSATGLLEILAERDPLLITSLDRPSLLADPETRAQIDARTAREGSSSGASFTTQLGYKQTDDGVELTIGAIAVEDLLAHVQGRILFEREFSLMGRGSIVCFRPAETAGFGVDAMELVVDTNEDLARELLEKVRPVRGRYTFDALPALTIEVIPTELKDPHGGTVTKVIG